MNKLLLEHGGYRNLLTFQLAQLIFDITVRFCNRFIDKRSRTHDQMVQAARSGVQNIAEGSQASATSKKTEIKLTNVARASLEELRLDYLDYIRQNNLILWAIDDPLRQQVVDGRFKTADAYALWVKKVCDGRSENVSEVAANGILVLLRVICTLLDRQIQAQAKAFEEEGGFTERLYKVRGQARNNNSR